MKEEMERFIRKYNLTPFNDTKTLIKNETESIYKTRDAKTIHTKVLNHLSKEFVFKETNNLWNLFNFTNNYQKIKKRQEFFKTLTKKDSAYLKKIQKPRRKWKPKYDIIAVTEEENTFIQLNELGCATQLLVSENDVMELERYDIVQVVDCNDYQLLLERLPQTVFLNSIEDVYLERYLEELSGWKENYYLLKKESTSTEIQNLLLQLEELFDLLQNKESSIITETEVEKVLEIINEKINEKVKELTITGEGLIKMLSEGKMPPVLLDIIRKAIEESGISEHIFNIQIPVTIDYKELEEQIKRQSANEYTNIAEQIKRKAEKLKNIPIILEYLSTYLLIEDFCNTTGNWIQKNMNYPQEGQELQLLEGENLFLNKAQPISFLLNKEQQCSILTGANSGGKTTLIEHLLQNNTLYQLGLPIKGELTTPTFTDIYYFAKNKGSASKGAFETLLTQMAKITPGEQTLILADEIEAVTEPGVAGKIISATAEYFIQKNCYLILATHLGHEIKKTLTTGARIDGIEAKGLDEKFNLLVDHNPILGKLAHSTPELIVERMANAYEEEYFKHLHKKLQEKN